MTGEVPIDINGAPLEPERAVIPTDVTPCEIKHAGMDLLYVREQQQPGVSAYNIWVPGFFGIHAAYANLRSASAQLDSTTGDISMHAPRKQDFWHSLSWESNVHPSLMLAKAVWGVMKDTALETGVEKFNLIGHSMGGPAVVNTAKYITERKDISMLGIVMLNASAGVTNHNIASLAPRAGRLLYDEIRSNRQELAQRVGGIDRAVAARELVQYMFHRQTFLEMLAVSHCNILGKVAWLSEAGVQTAGLFFPADPLFDIDRAEANLRGRIHVFKAMEEPLTAGHIAPQLYPTEVATENRDLRRQFAVQEAA